jgi:3-hydroxymyristoyl/3-hydroxydecanoyl-(acyl carrier protein) dehydratase/acyl carrier protein
MSDTKLTEAQKQELRDELKRCPSGTFEAAITFRETMDAEQVPIIVMGVIDRFLEPEARPKLRDGSQDVNLIDELGIDSLTMLEIVMLLEKTLQISFDNEELRDLRTIGDVNSFMAAKIKGEAHHQNVRKFPIEKIAAIMPHQEPFLFLETASIAPGEATGTYIIKGSESFLQGHFKDRPVFPASIMIEALGQLAVFYLLAAEDEKLHQDVDCNSIYFASCDGVRCHRICKPGDILTLQIKPRNIRHPLALFHGSITVDGEKASIAEEIKLAFDYEQATLPEISQGSSNGNGTARGEANKGGNAPKRGRLSNPKKV